MPVDETGVWKSPLDQIAALKKENKELRYAYEAMRDFLRIQTAIFSHLNSIDELREELQQKAVAVERYIKEAEEDDARDLRGKTILSRKPRKPSSTPAPPEHSGDLGGEEAGA